MTKATSYNSSGVAENSCNEGREATENEYASEISPSRNHVDVIWIRTTYDDRRFLVKDKNGNRASFIMKD